LLFKNVINAGVRGLLNNANNALGAAVLNVKVIHIGNYANKLTTNLLIKLDSVFRILDVVHLDVTIRLS